MRLRKKEPASKSERSELSIEIPKQATKISVIKIVFVVLSHQEHQTYINGQLNRIKWQSPHIAIYTNKKPHFQSFAVQRPIRAG